MSKDYYTILGVNKNATQEDILKAKKSLSKKYHPDLYVDEKEKEKAKNKFQDVEEAYGVLSDKNKRAVYDNGGDPRMEGGGGFDDFAGFGGFGGGKGFQSGGFSFDFGNLNDLFGFEHGRSSKTSFDGSDIHFEITISLEDVYSGKSMDLKYSKQIKCTGCNATGAKDGKLQKCTYCLGRGKIQTRSFIGIIEQQCPYCHGAKQSPIYVCTRCDGKKIISKDESVSIKIPCGIHNDESLLLRNGGNEGFSGKNGNLILKIRIASHKRFKRDGNDLHLTEKVPISKMVLGGEHIIKGLMNDNISFYINANTQSDTKVKIANHGMTYNNSRGNLYINIQPIMPTHIPIEAQKHWEEIYKIENGSESHKKRGWFS